MPLVQIDIVLLTVLLLALPAGGVLVGWLVTRRRQGPPSSEEQPSEARQFLQLMSRADHTLDNYITSIQGHLSVLGEEMPTDPQRWQVSRDAIGEATVRMKRHIERLRLVRMGLDESTVRVAPVNLVRLVEHILIAQEPAATEKQMSIQMEVHRLAQPVPGDPQMLEEIFSTLLDNAIKHNPPGTQVVAELSRQNGMALARISDTGKGMSLELASRIFEEGARDRAAGSQQGTGMGLYIARMLTELHGGTISVESKLEHGSVFSVALPFASPQN